MGERVNTIDLARAPVVVGVEVARHVGELGVEAVVALLRLRSVVSRSGDDISAEQESRRMELVRRQLSQEEGIRERIGRSYD